jgi:hypothetical protein
VLWRCQWHAEELLVGPFLAGAENRYDQTRACGTENLWLFGRDANGIDRGIAAAAIALEAHPPHAIAARYRQICGVTNTGRDITAADHTLAGRAGRNDDVYRTRFFGHKFELSGLLDAGLLPDCTGLVRTA